MKYIIFFSAITTEDTPLVGSKNAALGLMIQRFSTLALRIPAGFALTTRAYWQFMQENNVLKPIELLLASLDVNNIAQLQKVGARIRALITNACLPDEIESEIRKAYQMLCQQYNQEQCDVAVRSSGTAEDLPEASFAGQQETFLAVRSSDDVLAACKQCIASLFSDRAIAYRAQHGFDTLSSALSVGVQKMVRSDTATAGIAFSLDTQSGSAQFVTISASYGLGQLIADGSVTPDELYVHKDRLKQGFSPLVGSILGSKHEKLVYAERSTMRVSVPECDRIRFALTNEQALEVARAVIALEDLYSSEHGRWVPVDVEWAYDGHDGHLYLVQVRPETVHSRVKTPQLTTFTLDASYKPTVLARGQSIGQKIVHGSAHVMHDMSEASTFCDGDILVTAMTDPDWLPLLKKAGGIITNSGGRTCHAAIISRELGIPAVVGTHTATSTITQGQKITLDCSHSQEGSVYEGTIPFTKQVIDLACSWSKPARLMLNIADPARACQYALLPAHGVGLTRLEFIIAQAIKIHPMALARPDLVCADTRAHINELARGYASGASFFVDKLSQAVGLIAGAFYPRPVIVRLSDFKSNEYRQLIGGSFFEPHEENPMIGFRGAARYSEPTYAPAFALECQALKKACHAMGFDNIILMVPFVRTIQEAHAVKQALALNGLKQGENNLKLYMMVEVPSNVLLIEQFAQLFDGFSIGSNDLTQLTLGIDRDGHLLASTFDERDPAVQKFLLMAIAGAQRANKPIGICGQAPSDYPELAQLLLSAGIDSLSLSPDALVPFIHAQSSPHNYAPIQSIHNVVQQDQLL